MFKSTDVSQQTNGGRRMYISWLRVLAVLLLFPFHTARVFNVGEQFYVKNDHVSLALSYLIRYMEPWHMPLLFLLAGAASWFALTRRSGRQYAGERFKRLLVPFLFGLVVLIPPQSYLGLLSHGGSAPGFFQWFPHFFQLNGADMDGYFLGGHTWGHLWFIIHLFFYALLALPVFLFLRRDLGRRAIDLLARAAAVPGVILLFGAALLPAMFVPEICGGNPVYYGVLFLLGYVLMADGRFDAAIDRHRRVALILGPVACIVTTWFEVTAWPAVPGWAQGPLHVYLAGGMTWCFMIALLAYGRRFLRASNRFVAYADEASYPVYLLHQTAIVMVAFVVVQWPVGVAVKFAVILLVSLLASVLTYELVVRRVTAVRFLFGMKSQRRASAAAAAPAAGTARVVSTGTTIPALRASVAEAAGRDGIA